MQIQTIECRFCRNKVILHLFNGMKNAYCHFCRGAITEKQ